jgi:hypothetical protein
MSAAPTKAATIAPTSQNGTETTAEFTIGE